MICAQAWYRTLTFALMMSLNMLIETSGGFACTGSDYPIVDARGRFPKDTREQLAGPDSMVVGIKP